jgi:hypothetical protein
MHVHLQPHHLTADSDQPHHRHSFDGISDFFLHLGGLIPISVETPAPVSALELCPEVTSVICSMYCTVQYKGNDILPPGKKRKKM